MSHADHGDFRPSIQRVGPRLEEGGEQLFVPTNDTLVLRSYVRGLPDVPSSDEIVHECPEWLPVDQLRFEALLRGFNSRLRH